MELIMDIDKICPGCMKEVENRNSYETCPLCGYDFKNHRAEPYQLQPFTILAGKYLVGKVIGEGGFGISYLGIDLNRKLPVAIKEYYPSGFVTRESNHTAHVSLYAEKNQADVDKWRDGFLNEARNLARFSNLNGIVEVRDYFLENNTAYIVMEYIDGITLKQYLTQNGGKIPVSQTFEMMEPVIRSLAKVHDSGMIHRDISPDNIMITKYGGMKLLDFGAAREFDGNVKKSLSIMLKPGYAPEEQYRVHGQQGPWSDVYAVTATIYKCITGVTPLESMERMRADTLKSPRELGVSLRANQEAALELGMAVYAENRLQNMDALYQILYADHQIPIDSPLPTKGFPAGKKRAAQGSFAMDAQKKKILIGAAVFLASLLKLLVFIAGEFEDSTSSGHSSYEASVEAPAEEAPVEEMPVEEALAEETPAEEVLAEETPAVEASAVEEEVKQQSKKKLVKEVLHNADGSVFSWEEYSYDSQGNMVKAVSHDADSSVRSWEEYIYDSWGNKIKDVWHNIDGSVSFWNEYSYDGRGNMIKDALYYADDSAPSVRSWNEYIYDSQGNRIKGIAYDAEGSAGTVSYWSEYIYDSQGNQIKEVSYYPDGSLFLWSEYSYDNEGNQIKEVRYADDGSVNIWTEYFYEE